MVAVINSPSDSRNQAGAGLGYDGVVRIKTKTGSGTGLLLWDGLHILTAAHVASASVTTVYFETASGVVSYEIAAQSNHPEFDALNNNSDLALLRLNRPAPDEANRYALYRDSDELGKTMTFVGYGSAATGAAGMLSAPGAPVRRIAENQFSGLMEQFKQSYGNEIAWSPLKSALLFADFDDGSAVRDAAGRFFGINDTGRGVMEGNLSPGDSGGPAFVDGKVAGIAAYQFRFSVGDVNPDINSATDSSFGEFAAWTRVSQFQQWIDQTVREYYPDAPTEVNQVKKTIAEGNVDTSLVYFLVQFKGIRTDSKQWLSVDYQTRDGIAKAGEDYIPSSGTLILYPGEDHAVIPVEIIGDTTPEIDETFYLDVTNPIGGSFDEESIKLTAVRTIINDDGIVQ